MSCPVVTDIDGTLSDETRAIDPRVLERLRTWSAPVVLATGKALPYPIALADFIGIAHYVIAENGGISVADDAIQYHGDRETAETVISRYRDAGHGLGWEEPDFINRWRETEYAIARDQPLAPLSQLAEEAGLEVIDSGYAYHLKSPRVSKGRALESVAAELGVSVTDFAAIGDSENDTSLFERAGRSFAVANADAAAKGAAQTVTESSFADGFLEALNAL